MNSIELHPYCSAIPEMAQEDYKSLKSDISGSGLLEPIVLFQGMILDGRHRYRACLALDIEPWVKDYDGPDSPMDYVISMNLRRRHLSESQRAQAMANLCGLARGGDRRSEDFKSATAPLITQSSAAKRAGVSIDTMKRAVSVEKHGTPELKRSVLNGETSVRDAAKKATEMKRKAEETAATNAPSPEPKPLAGTVPVITVDGKTKQVPNPKETKFNKTNGNVGWASWTWNPITGCNHGCSFCYARAITHNGQMAANYPFGFEPAFYEYRLNAPKNTKVPLSDSPADGRVFVGSMADVFGKWVPDEWIQNIFDACMDNPEWEYLFLTKWPNRYKMLESLPKAWFGASVIQQADVARVEREMKSFTTTGVKWISLEPMLEPITFSDLSWCDLVVIGAQTATSQPDGYVPEKAADFEWVWDLVRQCKEAQVPYYLKPNLLQSPGMILLKGVPVPRVLPRSLRHG